MCSCSRHRGACALDYETLALAMSCDPPAYVSHFEKKRQLPFSVVVDNTGKISKQFGDIVVAPTTFVIARCGTVVKRHDGPPDFGSTARVDRRPAGAALIALPQGSVPATPAACACWSA